MSIAGITSTLVMVLQSCVAPRRPRWGGAGSPRSGEHSGPAVRRTCLAVIRELQRDRDVLRFAQRLDNKLQGVLVLADHAELIALDPHLDFGCRCLDPL